MNEKERIKAVLRQRANSLVRIFKLRQPHTIAIFNTYKVFSVISGKVDVSRAQNEFM